MEQWHELPPANYPPPAPPPKQPCNHKYVFMETVRQKGQRPSGYSNTIDWKRIDRFYWEKCLEIKERIQTSPGYEDKPDWFD